MLQIQAFTFSPIEENTYLLFNESGHCMVIDPGCYFDEEKDRLKAFIQSKNLLPTLLLNTHCHLDHVFGNKYVAETFGLTLHLHQKEQAVLAYAPTSGLMYNMPFDNYQGPVNLLKEGDVISLGEDQLTCFETPGHSPGSLCFYSRTQGFIIGGDVLFKRGIGRTDLPFGSHETLLNSIREKLFVLPPETIVYPGHGPSTTIGEEIRENPFL